MHSHIQANKNQGVWHLHTVSQVQIKHYTQCISELIPCKTDSQASQHDEHLTDVHVPLTLLKAANVFMTLCDVANLTPTLFLHVSFYQAHAQANPKFKFPTDML